MHFVRIRVSVRLGLGLGLILHKTSTLNINRNPQNLLFQVALGDIFGPKKSTPLLLLPLLATFNKLNILPWVSRARERDRGGDRERERERETARHIHLYTGTDLTIIDQQWLIQRPVHQSFGLVKCTVGLVGLVKKWGI